MENQFSIMSYIVVLRSKIIILIGTLITMCFMSCNANGQHIGRDRYCFHHRHYNEGGVCLLSSYGFVLEFANSTVDEIASFDNFDMMEKYLTYHSTLEPVQQLSADYLCNYQKEGEEVVSQAINGYCMARHWSGYIQVQNFHEWLRTKTNWCDNIEIVDRVTISPGSDNLMNRISQYLLHNTDKDAQYDYAAVICFTIPNSGNHSVFLGYDGTFFIRDVNFTDRFYDNKASFDFTLDKSDRLFEYMIFKIKRNARQNRGMWKPVLTKNLGGILTNENKWMKTSNPIKIKHLRFDHSKNVGIDGTIYYTSFVLKSPSHPGLEVEIANYFPKGHIRVNCEWKSIGQKVKGAIYEYDLEQIAKDLYVDLYHQNADFSAFSFQ